MNKKFELSCDYTLTFGGIDLLSNTRKYHFHCNYVDNETVSLYLRERETYCPVTETLVITRYNKPKSFISDILMDDNNDQYIMIDLGFADREKVKLSACWDLDLDIEVK